MGKLVAGTSGIHRITRFPTDKLRTTIGGSVDFLLEQPFSATQLSFALARTAAAEAIGQAQLGKPGDFPGELFLASPPVEHEWPQRQRLDNQAPAPRIPTRACWRRPARRVKTCTSTS